MADTKAQTQIIELEQRIATLPTWVEQHEKKLKYGGLAVAAVVLAPVVWTGVVGLVGGLVFTGIAIAGTQFLPVWAKRMANAKAEAIEREATRHLQALRQQANANPVETLWNGFRRDQEALQRRRDALVALDGKARAFGAKLEGFRKKFNTDAVPELAKYEERQRKMIEIVDLRRRKLGQLTALLEDKRRAIELGEGIWELALASKEFDDADGRSAEEKFFADFKEKTAFDSIEQAWSTSGAEFDQMMAEEMAEFRPSKTLGYQP